MRAAAFAIVSLFAIRSAAQTTTSTMCQATEVVLAANLSERRLVGCGEGFSENLLWHLDRADSIYGTLDGKVTRRATGRGVVIYVIDTGVLAAHAEFADATGSRVLAGIPAGGNCPPDAPCWFTQNPSSVLTAGHGTGVASVAAGRNVGIAPDASVVAVMNAGDVPFFTTQLRRIIEHAYAPTTPPFRTAIINISAVLGLADPHVPELDALIRRMTTGVNAAGEADPNGKRFFFSTIAGNKYADPFNNQCGAEDAVLSYPSILAPSIDGLVAVGGIDRENHYWAGSCKGPAVELLAPAPEMFVASVAANDTYRFKPADQISGTSWSAPYVSGMAALLLELDPNRSPAELEALLKASPSRVSGLAVPIMPGNEPAPPTGPRRRSARH